jgi:acyl-CoA reductase-like NAD-dependent aldehyde dehydrogenase
MTPLPFATEAAACRAAQQTWATLPVRERLRPVRALRQLLVARTGDLVAAVAADVGRSRAEVVGTELLPAASALKFLLTDAARLLAPRRVGRRPIWLLGSRDTVYRRPWGVVGVIGTWNYPVFLNVGPIAQALVAGNGVLWKPSELAPRSAEVTARLFADAGFPPGLLTTLPATREAGPQLAEAAVDHVVFTGSDVVGRRLAARLGDRLIPSTLELSGCDAMFVLADADVPFTAQAAWFGVTLNRGQTCIAVRRVFVHRSRLAEFTAALQPLVTAAGPMTLATPGQADQLGRLVRDAVGRGATVLSPERPNPPGPPSLRGKGGDELPTLPAPVGGREARGSDGERVAPEPEAGKVGSSSPPFPLREGGPGGLGSAVVPTILLNAPADAAVCREAAFAPVCAVLPFDTIDEALSQAAASPFGLAASVFTTNPRSAEVIAARIPAGSVTVNDVIAPTAHPATPFGGRGASGWGVTQGAEGLLAMTVPQAVSVRRGRFRPHVDEVVDPDPEATADILIGLLRASHAAGLREWLGGVRQLIRGVRRKRR